MSDRVSASIIIGGAVSAADFPILAQMVAGESLSTHWDGPWFTPGDFTPGRPLWVKARDVLGGRFDELEAWCVAHGLSFVRWSGASPGSWTPGRVVFTGRGEPTYFPLDEDDGVLIDEQTFERLGDVDAVRAWFDLAAFSVPPLVVG